MVSIGLEEQIFRIRSLIPSVLVAHILSLAAATYTEPLYAIDVKVAAGFLVVQLIPPSDDLAMNPLAPPPIARIFDPDIPTQVMAPSSYGEP
jgi:hypothetical protein